MAINIGGLLENIGNSVGDFISVLKGDAPKDGVYVDVPNLAPQKLQSKNWTKSLPYVFGIVKDANSNVPHGKGFIDFSLPINPTDLSQSEPPAIIIKPTQGGTTVSHNGMRYKDLIIKGTTGVHPGRGAGGASKRTGKANFQPNEMKYVSGYESFLRLRNWFRSYYHQKATNPDFKDAALVFKNYKDGEFLIVELVKFDMDRSASIKLHRNYVLTFRVLGHVEFAEKDSFLKGLDEFLDNALDAIDTARGIFLRTGSIVKQIESTYDATVLEALRKTSLMLKALTGAVLTAADLGPNLIKKTLTAKEAFDLSLKMMRKQLKEGNAGTLDSRLSKANITFPNNLQKAVANSGTNVISTIFKGDSLQAVQASDLPISAVNALADEQAAAIELPRSFFEDTLDNLVRVRDNAADRFGLGDTLFNSIYNRTNTLDVDTGKELIDDEFEVLQAFNSAIQGLNLFLSTNQAFKSSYAARIADFNDQFGGSLNLKAEQAVKEIPLPAGYTLERLALQELGDPDRWVEISELNGLKPPYIVDNMTLRTKYTLAPGDKILIPQPVKNGFATSPIPRDLPLFNGMTEAEKNLGVDLRLTDTFDLELTNNNDIQTIKGLDNAAQAIVIKLSIEQGDILKHPELGVGLVVGSKTRDLGEIQDDLFRTLTQDPRFESVNQVELININNQLNVKFTIKFKNVDTPIPVEIRV